MSHRRVVPPTQEQSSEAHDDFTVTPRVLLLSSITVVIGIISPFVAMGLLRLTALFTNLFYFQRWSTAASSLAQNTLGAMAVIVPVIGAVIIGPRRRYFPLFTNVWDSLGIGRTGDPRLSAVVNLT
jgi:hypothetical protein